MFRTVFSSQGEHHDSMRRQKRDRDDNCRVSSAFNNMYQVWHAFDLSRLVGERGRKSDLHLELSCVRT